MEKKEEKKKVYSVPIYIDDAIKRLNKLRQKEEVLLQQLNDYIIFANIPKDTPFELLKYIPDDDVIPGQTKLEI